MIEIVHEGTMGRPTNEKCWACSLLSVAEARKTHDEAIGGDGCWTDATCPSRRSYYRKGRGRLAQRKTAIATVVVPVPAMSYVVLHTYVDQVRQPQDDVVIHAMCAEVWVGGEPIAMT